MPSAELIAELEKLLSPKAVLSAPAELAPFQNSAFSAEHPGPAVAVFPTSTEQVVAVVKVLARHKVSIVPRGGGTGLTGGSVAPADGVVISTSRMNRILKIDLENRVAHVEAGVRNSQLTEAVALLPNGPNYHFAPDPSSQRTSSIGGNAATNAGGVRTLIDYVTSSHIFGMEVVLPEGQVLDIGGANGSCESCGFDLPGLICGSEGTLGIITTLWVRLTPKALASRTISAVFRTSADAFVASTEITAAGFLPAAMEMLDGPLLQVIESTFHLGFTSEAGAFLLIELDGFEPLIESQLEDVVRLCRKLGALKVETASDPAARAALSRARKSAFGAIARISRAYATQDACVPRNLLERVLQQIRAISQKHGITIHNLVHAADGNLHPIFLYDEHDEDQTQRTMAAIDDLLKYCVEVGGTFAGEHGVGVEKAHLLPLLFDLATLQQFHAVKTCFDPDNRINAGKRMVDAPPKLNARRPARNVPQ